MPKIIRVGQKSQCHTCGKTIARSKYNADSFDLNYCPICYEIAGLDNSYSDGHITKEEYEREVKQLEAKRDAALLPHSTINKHVQTPHNVIHCACGGYYQPGAWDQKQHERTQKHFHYLHK